MISKLLRLIAQTLFLTVYLLNLIVIFCLGLVWVLEDQFTWALLKQEEAFFWGSTYFGWILVVLPLLAILSFVFQGALKTIRVATNTGTIITLAPSAVEDCVAEEIRESESPVRGVWVRASQGGLLGSGRRMHLRAEVTARLSQPVSKTSQEVEQTILNTLRNLYGIESKDVVITIVITDVVPMKRSQRTKPATSTSDEDESTRTKSSRRERPQRKPRPVVKEEKPETNDDDFSEDDLLEESTHQGDKS